MLSGNQWTATDYDRSFAFVSRLGGSVLELLAARPGERILDLGCGTGLHAATMVEHGVAVVGVDASREMLSRAREAAPAAEFFEVDATTQVNDLGLFDAVFSNAALHWMRPQEAALSYARSALPVGGRFVAEMGGRGNLAIVLSAFSQALQDCGLRQSRALENWYPSIAQQSELLEAAGFDVRHAELFSRPTPLDPGLTAADWCQHFRADTWSQVPEATQARLRKRVNEIAAPRLLDGDLWFIDYWRLRFVAIAS